MPRITPGLAGGGAPPADREEPQARQNLAAVSFSTPHALQNIATLPRSQILLLGGTSVNVDRGDCAAAGAARERARCRTRAHSPEAVKKRREFRLEADRGATAAGGRSRF